MGKFGATSTGTAVLRGLGCESPKDVNRKMQFIALNCITRLNYLECGVYSTAFAKSALEILKNFSDIGKNNIDPVLIKTVMDMGFTESLVIQAIKAINSENVEKIMDYLINNKDQVGNMNEDPIFVENLHRILINSLPAIPSLRLNVAEILIKLCNKPSAAFKEIAFMLLKQIGILAEKKLGEPCLLMAFDSCVELNLLEVPLSFEQLAACIQVLSVLANKSADILEIIHSHKFTSHAIKLMESFTPDIDPSAMTCLSPLFSLLDTLCKYSSDTDERLMIALCNLVNNHKNTQCPEQPDLHSLLQVFTTLTLNPPQAKIFIDNKALQILLTLKMNEPEEKLKTNLNFYGILLKQLVEDPYILQTSFEISILQNHRPGVELKDLLKLFPAQLSRSKEIFRKSFENSCQITKKNNKFIVEINKERKEIIAER